MPQLLGDPLGDRPGGDPARLGVPDHARDPAAQLQADLGQLGGLAGAGLAGDDHHLVVADRGGDVVLALADRQLLGVGDRGHARTPRGHALLGGVDVGGDLVDDLLVSRFAPLAKAVDPALQTAPVEVHQLR